MRILIALLFLPLLSLSAQQTTTSTPLLNLMPFPASVQTQPGRLSLDASFTVGMAGKSDARLEAAVQRMQQRIAGRTGIVLIPGVAKAGQPAKLTVQVESLGERYPKLGEDESYSLAITATGATLRANTSLGALRGLETVLQLVSADKDGYYLPLVTIEDEPRFAWRGLMIDVGRHFQPVEVIKRNIDGLAAVKMNVLHWHLSDDQGFRVESKKYPRLQEMGSDGLYYTQEQVREVVDYAAARGVRVVPEFDMPGHTTAWFVGYPELASAPGPYQIERKFGVFDPTMDPTRDEIYKFLDGFLGEMAQLFPDEFMHIGGDENNGKQWKANPKIQEFMQKHGFTTTAQLQTYFSQRVREIVQKHGKRVIGWDEILTPELPKDAVVQGWHGRQSLADAAQQGHLAIWSTAYYLDHMAPADYVYLADPVPLGHHSQSGGGQADSGWRGVRLGRVSFAGDHRQPGVATHGGDRGAVLVAARCARCGGHVPAAGRDQCGTGAGWPGESRRHREVAAASHGDARIRPAGHAGASGRTRERGGTARDSRRHGVRSAGARDGCGGARSAVSADVQCDGGAVVE